MAACPVRAVTFGAGHGNTWQGQQRLCAIRAASQDDVSLVEHGDFDHGGPLFDGKPVCCIDAGDTPTTSGSTALRSARSYRHLWFVCTF
jgi:agmatinase